VHAIGRFAHEALVIDGSPLHPVSLLSYFLSLRKSLFGDFCRIRFLLNHVNVIRSEFPAVADGCGAQKDYEPSEFKSLSNLSQLKLQGF